MLTPTDLPASTPTIRPLALGCAQRRLLRRRLLLPLLVAPLLLPPPRHIHHRTHLPPTPAPTTNSTSMPHEPKYHTNPCAGFGTTKTLTAAPARWSRHTDWSTHAATTKSPTKVLTKGPTPAPTPAPLNAPTPAPTTKVASKVPTLYPTPKGGRPHGCDESKDGTSCRSSLGRLHRPLCVRLLGLQWQHTAPLRPRVLHPCTHEGAPQGSHEGAHSCSHQGPNLASHTLQHATSSQTFGRQPPRLSASASDPCTSNCGTAASVCYRCADASPHGDGSSCTNGCSH
jgi:hypothetical protein